MAGSPVHCRHDRPTLPSHPAPRTPGDPVRGADLVASRGSAHDSRGPSPMTSGPRTPRPRITPSHSPDITRAPLGRDDQLGNLANAHLSPPGPSAAGPLGHSPARSLVTMRRACRRALTPDPPEGRVPSCPHPGQKSAMFRRRPTGRSQPWGGRQCIASLTCHIPSPYQAPANRRVNGVGACGVCHH
jgi:hypothetical protein